MNIVNFLIEHGGDILWIICALLLFVTGRLLKDYPILQQRIFALVTEAENKYGAKTGELKLAYVIDGLYKTLPEVIRLVITQKWLKTFIEDGLKKAKEKWADNPNLLSGLQIISGLDILKKQE